jgi:hypothetical protein
MGMITTKAKKTLLVISPAGTGKSVASNLLCSQFPESKRLDSVTRAGLEGLQKYFNNFRGLVVIDDLGKIDTHYSRLATITTFCELVYSHFVEKHTRESHILIQDFQGSAILNCQPVVLRRVVESPEWESTIQDKTIRYYHLYRPLNPKVEPPNLSLNWGIGIDKVEFPFKSGEALEELKAIGNVQWQRGRINEHIPDLAKAVASFEGERVVKLPHLKFLIELLKPMLVERYVFTKTDFESGRSLNSNLLCLMIEFASYGEFTLRDLATDYKISEATARRLLEMNHYAWQLKGKNPTVFTPSDSMKKILEEVKGG